MCDLIDLDSSGTNNILETKLASPLIAAPKNVERNDVNNHNKINEFVTEECGHLNNNPFDMVFNKTIEYVRKKEDPFEIVLEEAFEPEDDLNEEDRIKFVDNYDAKSKTCAEEPSSEYNDHRSQNFDANDLSILNDSSMNDSLSEINSDVGKSNIKSANEDEIHSPINNGTKMSDLIHSFNKLKLQVLGSQITGLGCTNFKGSYNDETVERVDTTPVKDTFGTNKNLSNIGGFTSEKESHESCTKNSISIVPLDSVDSISHQENNSINKLISREAKVLETVFDELAQEHSESSVDELITSDPLWISQLVPAFDDEPLENLIELSVSKNLNNDEKYLNEESGNRMQSASSEIESTVSTETSTKAENNPIKDLETELIDKKLTASILVQDLKKVIESESELLKSLEGILKIQCDNNTDSQAANDLNRSTNVYGNNLKTAENINENVVVDTIENNKELCTRIALNDMNTGKVVDKNEKSFYSFKCENTSRSNDNLEDISRINSNSEIVKKEENNSSFLHSSIKMLHSTSNDKIQHETNKEMQIEPNPRIVKGLEEVQKIHQMISDLNQYWYLVHEKVTNTPIKNKSQDKCETEPLNASGSKSIQNVEVSSNSMQVGSFTNRSIKSAGESPDIKVMPDTPTNKSKNKFHLKELKNRFSRDSGSINSISNKETYNNRTNTRNKYDKIKETQLKVKDRRDRNITEHFVKSKLNKKLEVEVSDKKGPMKAILPLKSMQKKGIITPSKFSRNSLTLPRMIGSKPNAVANKSAHDGSKPIASSTPDAQKCKKGNEPSIKNNKNHRLSCDISPIIAQDEMGINQDELNCNSNKVYKDSSSKKVTPKKCQVESSIPKYFISPNIKKKNVLRDINNSPNMLDTLTTKMESRQIPKLRRFSSKNSVFGKENNYDIL